MKALPKLCRDWVGLKVKSRVRLTSGRYDFPLLSKPELNADDWTTFFCPANGATMHTKKGTPPEPCEARLDWLRRYEGLNGKRGFGNPLTNESNRQKAREYKICRTCHSRPSPNSPQTAKPPVAKKVRPRSGKLCSCGQKHYAKGMCKTCYMADYNKGWGR